MKTKFRVLSVIMTVAMILSSLVIVVPTTVSAETDATLWSKVDSIWEAAFDYDELETDGETITNMPGTAANPYQIDTADELALLAYYVNNNYTDDEFSGEEFRKLHYVVTGDIDATAHQWMPIGNSYTTDNTANYFSGTFDGGNYTIKTAITDSTAYAKYVNPDTKLQVYYSNAEGTAHYGALGGLFGRIHGARNEIKNVKLETTMTALSIPVQNLFVGGLTGVAFGADIDNCHVTVNASGDWQLDYVFGGVAGYTNDADNNMPTISNSTVEGTVNVRGKTTTGAGKSLIVGGLVGRVNTANDPTEFLTNCVNYMDIIVRSIRTGTNQSAIVGGLVGKVETDDNDYVYINNCANFGDLMGTGDDGDSMLRTLVGGAIGYNADAKAILIIDGFANFGQMYFSQQRASDIVSGAAEIIGADNGSSHAERSITNCYTLTGGDAIWNYSAKTVWNGVETALAVKTYYRMEDILTHIGIDYEVGEDATTVLLNKGAMDVLKACGITVTVKRGSASTVVDWENATATDTVYQIPVSAASGAVSVQTDYVNAANDVVEATQTIEDLWIYRAADAYAGGDGLTADTPYIIETAEQLARVARDWQHRVQNTIDASFKAATGYRYYKLNADIDLAGREWVPIGSYGVYANQSLSFLGDFDGNEKTIKNMTITEIRPANDAAGLFGTIRGMETTRALIHDFTMTGAKITRGVVATDIKQWNRGTGLVAGSCHGYGTIDNVNATGTILVLENVGEGNMVGGILGGAHNAIVKNSTMNGTVTNKSNASGKIPVVGGIVGQASGTADIINCTNNAKVVAQGYYCNTYAGGIIGYAGNQMKATAVITIEGCTNNGEITTAKATTNPNNARLGGIIGGTGRSSDANATKGIQPVSINNCINTGYVHAAVGGGGASGYGYIIGLAEDNSTNGSSYALNITNVYSPYIYSNAAMGKDADNPGALAMFGSVSDKVNINGDGNDRIAGHTSTLNQTPEKATYTFEVGVEINGEAATIKASKMALDIFLAAGYTMKITYGDAVITSVTDAVANNSADTYTWTTYVNDLEETVDIPAATGEPTLVCSRNGDEQSAFKGSWSGIYSATSFAGGTGTADDPYMIETAAQLGRVAKLNNDPRTDSAYRKATYSLVYDIDLAGHEWTPMGLNHTGTFTFDGDIIGNNKKIKNMTLTEELYWYCQAFVGRSNGSFSMTNVTFVNPKIRTGGSDVYSGATVKATAVVVGAMYGGTLTNVDVTDLNLNMSRGRSGLYYGGVVGYLGAQAAVVDGCDVTGRIYGSYTDNSDMLGGIVARARYGTVKNCVSNVNIDVTVSSNNVAGGTVYIGGILGSVNGDSLSDMTTVTDNTNNGSITVVHKNGGRYVSVAGIVGAMICDKDFTANIEGNVNTGNVNLVSSTASASKESGGIIGTYSASAITLKNNTDYAVGKLTASALNVGSADAAIAVNEGNYVIDTGLTTKDGAAVRIDTINETSGLRFTSSFTTAKYEELVAKYGEGNVTFGTIIAPTALMDRYGANQLPASVVVPYTINTANGVNGFAAQDSTTSTFNGAIVQILKKNYTLDFTAVAYMNITANGTTYTIYSDYVGEDDRARNIKEVADMAFSDRVETAGFYNGDDYYTNYADGNGYSCYSAAQLDLLVKLYGAEFITAEE